MKRHLSLKRETLTELSTADLTGVVAGAATTPLKACILDPSANLSCYQSCMGSCWCTGAC